MTEPRRTIVASVQGIGLGTNLVFVFLCLRVGFGARALGIDIEPMEFAIQVYLSIAYIHRTFSTEGTIPQAAEIGMFEVFVKGSGLF